MCLVFCLVFVLVRNRLRTCFQVLGCPSHHRVHVFYIPGLRCTNEIALLSTKPFSTPHFGIQCSLPNPLSYPNVQSVGFLCVGRSVCGCGREMCALPSISLKINAANNPLQWASLLDNQLNANKLNNGWLRSRLWLWMRVCVLSNASSGAQLSNVRLAHAPAGRSSKWTFQQEH